MRKRLSTALALCWMLVFLTVAAIPTQAAEDDPEKALQRVYYFDMRTEELLEESTTGVLVKNGSSNLVITVFPSKEDQEIYTIFTTENDDVDYCLFSDSWNQIFYLYSADAKYGETEGFTEQGTVTQGETVYLVLGWDADGQKGGYQTIAEGYENGQITLKETPDKRDYPIPVLNSQNEVCAVFYGETCYSLITDEEIFYEDGKPEQTETENAPETESPAAEASGDDNSEEFGMPVELEELDTLYKEAVVQKKSSNVGTIVIAGFAVAAIFLTVLVIFKRKDKRKENEELHEAEEGTQLADEPPDTGLQLQLPTSVSGRHCEIVVHQGNAYLRDMGSTNGTFINGRRVPVGQLVQLQPGMNIGLGSAGAAESFTVVFDSEKM